MEGCTLDFDELIDDTAMVTKEDEFQRSLLEVKLVDKSTAKKQEAFQGSLLPAIITSVHKIGKIHGMNLC